MSVCLFVCVEGWGREFLPAMNSSAKARKCACLSQCAAAPVNVCVRVEYQHICTSECMQTSARVLAQVGAAIETATASAQDIEVCQSVSLPCPSSPQLPKMILRARLRAREQLPCCILSRSPRKLTNGTWQGVVKGDAVTILQLRPQID
jgi:hypothetical protein